MFDRREGELCVLTRGEETISLPEDALPHDAREGDTLVHTAEGWRIDARDTAAVAAMLFVMAGSAAANSEGVRMSARVQPAEVADEFVNLKRSAVAPVAATMVERNEARNSLRLFDSTIVSRGA